MGSVLKFKRSFCDLHKTTHVDGTPCKPPADVQCPGCSRLVSNEPERCLEHLVICDAGDAVNLGRDEAIKRIRTGLLKRSGKAWSVTGGRGTAWGWIHISAPPRRRVSYSMTPEDAAELGALLGFDGSTHHQYVGVAASSDHYAEYVARAEGRTPTRFGTQYWD